MSKRLFFSVGEPSGDLHAANLIRSLLAHEPNLRCRGFGGVRMVQAGLECDYDLTELAVMGLVEVLPKLKQFFRRADQAEALFQNGEVDGVVLVDFPGFNWHIAKRAKKYGLPVYYYLPPQLWVWGGWRVRKLRRTVDHVLCNLPFERDWFASHHVDADYVGHPFFDEIASNPLDPRFLQHWHSTDRLQVAVLPGSRDHEVHGIWPMQIEVIRRLHAAYPDVRFLVAAYKDAHALWCRSQLVNEDAKLPIEIFVGKTSEIIELADCSLTKSGSVSLEMMARGTPSVVVYRIGRVFHTLIRLLSRCKTMSIPNLIAGETVMPEYLSVGKSAKSIDAITGAMRQLLSNEQFRERQRCKLLELAKDFAQPGASQRAAEHLLKYLDTPNQPNEPSHRVAA